MNFEQANILMVNYHFPPVKGIGTLRIHKFYKSFGEIAQKRFVITTSNRSLLMQDPLPVDENVVFECKTYDYRTFLSGFHKNKGSHFSFNKDVSSLMSNLRKLLISFPTNLIIGEGGPSYIFSAYFKAVEILEKEKINTLFSSYGPFVDHVICYLLKIKFPHLYWIADFRDVHAEPNLKQVIMSGFQEKVLKNLLKKVDLVTTVSLGLQAYYKRFHKNVEVIVNGYDTAQMNIFPSMENRNFNISYTGSVYKDLQNSSIIFKALDELVTENKIRLDDIKIIYAGKDTNLFKTFLENTQLKEKFISYGLVAFKESQVIQQNSNVNILLSWTNNDMRGILTAKVFEYVFARRPIITVINGIKDAEFATFEKSLSKCLVVTMEDERDSVNKVKEFLLKKYRYWLIHKEREVTISDASILEYSWKSTFSKFLDRIEDKVQVNKQKNPFQVPANESN